MTYFVHLKSMEGALVGGGGGFRKLLLPFGVHDDSTLLSLVDMKVRIKKS
jgi:hypothetical protein